MSLRNRWQENEILEALTSSKLTFVTLREAESFRYACYSLRRRKLEQGYTTGYGIGYSFVLSEETDEDNTLVFTISILRTPQIHFTKEKAAS